MKNAVKWFSGSLLMVGLLTACQQTRVPLQSELELPQQFSQAEAGRGRADISRWWRNWHDPVLTELIERGLQHSHDIRIAQARLLEARQTSRMANADLGPNMGLSGSAGLVRGKMDSPLSEQSRAMLGQLPGAASLAEETQSMHANPLLLEVSATWEPDIFGAKRSDADAAYYAALGMQEKVYGTQMLVAGDIADNYLKARSVQAQMQVSERIIQTLRRLQQYVDGRFQAGQVTRYEQDEVRSKLSAALAQQSTLQAEYAAYERNLAVLSAQTPQTYKLPESPVTILKQTVLPPSGQTPAGLLERRPDIRAYAAQVHAYAAKFASAQADLLPRFTINFLGQGARIGLDGDSPDLKGWASLLSVGIQLPLFTNGRIQANIAASDARLQTALLQYDQAVLKALGEVDSAYQTQAALARQNILITQAHQLAAQQANDADKLFRYGEKTLDNALTARLNEAEMAQKQIQSQVTKAQMLVNLYKALGGGWPS